MMMMFGKNPKKGLGGEREGVLWRLGRRAIAGCLSGIYRERERERERERGSLRYPSIFS